MAEYNLYIDESGEFRGHQRLSVVSGVLENASAGIDWNRARKLLADVLPLMPYPFHANLIHEPALWAAIAMLARAGTTGSTSPLLGEVCEQADPAVRALAGLARTDRAPVEGFLRALRAGQLPDKGCLLACSGFLKRRAMDSYRTLEALRDRMRSRLETRYRQLLQGCGADLTAVAAVADAQASEAADYSGPAESSVRRDGYVRALETLIERVLCLLQGGGACQLNLWVASRYVELRGYGTLALGAGSVLEIAGAAARLPRLPGGTPAASRSKSSQPEIAIKVQRGVVNYDASAPMGLVLADYLSNRVRYALAQAAHDLPTLNRVVQERCGLRLEGAPRHALATRLLPTIAWDGEARAVVRRVCGGEAAPVSGLRPRANQEQAEQWASFARSTWEASEP